MDDDLLGGEEEPQPLKLVKKVEDYVQDGALTGPKMPATSEEFGEDARISFTPATAEKLARVLKLSDLQKEVCHAYLTNPDAIAVDVAAQLGISDHRVSKILTSPRCRAYIRALTGAATNPTLAENRKALEKTKKVVTSVRKCLQLLGNQATLQQQEYMTAGVWDHAKLAKAPPGVIRKITYTDLGTMNVEFESSQKAVSRILDYFAEARGLRKPQELHQHIHASVLADEGVRNALAAAVRSKVPPNVVDAEVTVDPQ